MIKTGTTLRFIAIALRAMIKIKHPKSKFLPLFLLCFILFLS